MLFISMIKYLRGYLVVTLSGYAPERFLNMCGRRDILIWDLKSNAEGYRFCISIDGFKSLKPIVKKTKTKVRIIEKRGVPFQLYRYRRRKMFFVGSILFAIALYRLSTYIWNIEIIGNSYLSNDIVLEFLEEENADFGTPIKEIDCAKLEETLRSTYPEVIWASVKIFGTKMTIELQESLLSEESYQKDTNTLFDIVSKKDGVITNMITRHGTPNVKEGSIVKKGDLLVSSALPIYSDYNETCTYIYESADADIIAEVEYDYYDTINKKYQEKSYTEGLVSFHQIQIGEFTIQNPFHKMPEGLFDMSVSYQQLCLGNNFFLPVYRKEIIYKPYKLVEKEYSDEEINQIAELHLRKYLENLEEKGIQIMQKNVIINKVGYSYFVTGKIHVLESVVSFQEAIIHGTDELEGDKKNEFD